jgi:hypothetical protein
MQWRGTALALAGYVLVTLAYLAARYAVLGQLVHGAAQRDPTLLIGAPLSTRVLTGLEILGLYARLLLWPVTLSADYSYRQLIIVHGLDGPGAASAVLPGVVALLALAALGGWALRRAVRPALFGVLFFCVSYSVVSNLVVPMGTLAGERLLYLPSVGFCVVVAFGLLAIGRAAGQRLAMALLVAVVGLYGARTVVRTFDWRDRETLYGTAARASPDCVRAHYNYAAALMEHRDDAEKNRLAREHLLRAHALQGDHLGTLVNLAIANLRLGRPAEGREFALKALGLQPGSRRIRGLIRLAEEDIAATAREN